jgi:predicted nucleic acid-binding protein
MADTPRLYIDSTPLIDLVKVKVGIKPESEAERAVFYVQRAVEAAVAKDVEIYTSVLSVAECTHVGDPAKLEAAKPFFLGLLASGKSGIRLIQTTLSIVERSRDLRWVTGANLRGADAVHVASAVHLGCDEFWTGDDRILRSAVLLKPLGTHICRPSETRLLPPEYLQERLQFGIESSKEGG